MGTFKYVLTWLFIFVVGSLIVSFLINPNSFNSFKENVKGTGNIIDSSNNVKQSLTKDLNLEDNYCGEGIIPEYFYLEKRFAEKFGSPIEEKFMSLNKISEGTKWADGQYIPNLLYGSGYLPCRKGSKEGENINYVYCFDLPYSRTDKEISKDGVVLDINEIDYKINLILNEVGNFTYRRPGMGQWNIINFSIVGAKCK